MHKILEIGKHLKIVHHLKGRIRIKISKQGLYNFANLTKSSSLSFKITDFKGVKDFRISTASFSCIINYDSNIIDPQDWHKLLENISDNNYQKALLILAKYKS